MVESQKVESNKVENDKGTKDRQRQKVENGKRSKMAKGRK